SGTLLNDRDDSSFIPYLLTANHCFSDQTTANTLEAYWDYVTATCGGSFPSISSKPKSSGSTLLATGAAPLSDFTLVRLNSIPSGRFFLGWTTVSTAVAPGTTIYRISHPFPDAFSQPGPQSFSTSTIITPTSTCQSIPSTTFIYSTHADGGVYGGSS